MTCSTDTLIKVELGGEIITALHILTFGFATWCSQLLLKRMKIKKRNNERIERI